MIRSTGNASEWWTALAGTAEARVSRSCREMRTTRAALAEVLQERVRRSLLAQPEAQRLIFTVVRGGTRSDQEVYERGPSIADPQGVLLWAKAAYMLERRDPFRAITVAHAQVICGDVEGASETLRLALMQHADHPGRFALWQNLGVVEALRGRPSASLEAYRNAAAAPARVDRVLAGIALCIAGAKCGRADDIRLGAELLRSADVHDASMRIAQAIRARRARGSEAYWGFDQADVEALRAVAPELLPLGLG